MAAKRISHANIVGEKGIACIRKAALDMGFMFHETGGVEAGIDGFIELRDSETGEVSNLIIQVQGKATEQRFPGETESQFTWSCEEKDINYWLYGTAPVLLIVVNTVNERAYWKSIKDYFKDASVLKKRTVVFNKASDVFDKTAKSAILEIASRARPGAITPPARISENIFLNLIRVEKFGDRLYLAETTHSDNKKFGLALRAESHKPPGEWIVKSGRVLSFHDLDLPPWRKVCDPGTIEEFSVDEWSGSEDPDKQRDFVQLLNRALNELTQSALRFDKAHKCYYFKRLKDRDRRAYSYRGMGKETSRNVVNSYTKKRAPNQHAFFRHSAFQARFLKFEQDWFLEITPTYFFTYDGFREDKFFSERLKKIKELENNNAVFGQFQMWSHFLINSTLGDMIRSAYPFLKFSPVPPFKIEHGVADNLWRSREIIQRASLFEGTLEDP